MFVHVEDGKLVPHQVELFRSSFYTMILYNSHLFAFKVGHFGSSYAAMAMADCNGVTCWQIFSDGDEIPYCCENGGVCGGKGRAGMCDCKPGFYGSACRQSEVPMPRAAVLSIPILPTLGIVCMGLFVLIFWMIRCRRSLLKGP